MGKHTEQDSIMWHHTARLWHINSINRLEDAEGHKLTLDTLHVKSQEFVMPYSDITVRFVHGIYC